MIVPLFSLTKHLILCSSVAAGKCIHFYRDGFGLSGAIVPCTFFNELDVNRRMVHDHLFATGYRPIFLDLMRQYTNDQFFQFEVKK
jgi:hypothetical protein